MKSHYVAYQHSHSDWFCSGNDDLRYCPRYSWQTSRCLNHSSRSNIRPARNKIDWELGFDICSLLSPPACSGLLMLFVASVDRLGALPFNLLSMRMEKFALSFGLGLRGQEYRRVPGLWTSFGLSRFILSYQPHLFIAVTLSSSFRIVIETFLCNAFA